MPKHFDMGLDFHSRPIHVMETVSDYETPEVLLDESRSHMQFQVFFRFHSFNDERHPVVSDLESPEDPLNCSDGLILTP